MQLAPILATAAVALAGQMTMAEAQTRTGLSGSSEFMEYVADFPAPPDLTEAKSLALCHLINKTHAFQIPIYYASQGYVLAENRCDTDSYLPLTSEQFRAAQASGAIPAQVPARPSVGLLRQLPPFGFGVVLLLGGLVLLQRRRRRQARSRNLSGLPIHVQRVLTVACHAAKADSEVGDTKIDMIAAIVQRTTDVEIDTDQIRRVVANCEKNLQQQDFAEFGKGLVSTQKELLMKVALIVVGSDGTPSKAELKFLNGLAAGLAISAPRYQRIVAEMA